MKSEYMCPYCGWKFDVRENLVPSHVLTVYHPSEMSAAALESGASEESIDCPGSGQYPRNALSDRRPLWKDLEPR